MMSTETGTGAALAAAPISEVRESLTLKPLKMQLHVTEGSRRSSVLSQVDRLAQALAEGDAFQEKVRITLGKLLLIVQRREFYKPDYESFEAYRFAVATKYKLSRATIGRALGIVRSLPMLEAGDVQDIPEGNLYELAKAVRRRGALPDKLLHDLLQAARGPLAEFREKLAKQDLRAPVASTTGTVAITLRVPAKLAKAWHNLVGDQNPAAVLAKLIGYKGRL